MGSTILACDTGGLSARWNSAESQWKALNQSSPRQWSLHTIINTGPWLCQVLRQCIVLMHMPLHPSSPKCSDCGTYKIIVSSCIEQAQYCLKNMTKHYICVNLWVKAMTGSTKRLTGTYLGAFGTKCALPALEETRLHANYSKVSIVMHLIGFLKICSDIRICFGLSLLCWCFVKLTSQAEKRVFFFLA